MDKLNIDTIKKRIQGETPKFFKIIINLMLGCTAIGGGLIAAKMATPDYFIWLHDSVPGYLITIGLVGAAVSKLATTPQTKEETPPQNL